MGLSLLLTACCLLSSISLVMGQTSVISVTTASTVSSNADCTFGVALNRSQNGPSNPLLADVVFANRLNSWVQINDRCRMSLDMSQSLVEICAGFPASSSLQLQTSGAFPSPIGFDWMSTSQNGQETGCRSALVSFSIGVAITLRLISGNVVSTNRQTGWSSFSISNSMFNSDTIFSGYSQESYSEYQILRFPNPNINPSNGLFNSADNTYECRNNGYYFFTFSGGVPAGGATQIILEGLIEVFAAQRLSTIANGLTTISRTVYVPCNTKVRLVNNFGRLEPGSGSNLISLLAFQYGKKSGNSYSWAAYRTSNSAAVDPLTFDNWAIMQAVVQTGNSTITIPARGFYYIYISIGTTAFQRSSATLRRNNNVVFSLDRLSTNFNDIDIIGHGTVILLEQNDVLKVVVEAGSSISSSTIGYHTSFIGMFLYD